MPAETIIATHRLAKHYGEVRAVDGIDFTVRRGEIYGFLGRNGAGKTTTIRMLLGLVRPSAGDVTMLGTRIRPGQQSVFARVGCLVETATDYPNLTVRENLNIQCKLTRTPYPAVDRAIALLHLHEYAKRPAGQLSLGNKQRLSLARALLHDPEVLVLDEPANALDPAGIVEIRDLLRHLADKRGVTIFMSSHILTEVAHLADRIGIVHEGRLIEELDYDELRAKARQYVEVVVSQPERAIALLQQQLGITRIEQTVEQRLRMFDGLDRVAEIARALVNDGLELTGLCAREEDLEDYFMRMTGGAA
ncbi:ABC transporter ATP-binding protein [candidate division FCPU426 bacterium]|nr:ABC transporter ATP-binding protein [candidate division FCPU426 bacterium]